MCGRQVQTRWGLFQRGSLRGAGGRTRAVGIGARDRSTQEPRELLLLAVIAVNELNETRVGT